MENRETITITTPIDGVVVILKAWITGREKRELRKPFIENIRFNIDENKPNVDMNSSDIMEKAENLAIENIVISINGEIEGKIEKILDLKSKDYDFVITEINKISKEERFLSSKKTPNTTTD